MKQYYHVAIESNIQHVANESNQQFSATGKVYIQFYFSLNINKSLFLLYSTCLFISYNLVLQGSSRGKAFQLTIVFCLSVIPYLINKSLLRNDMNCLYIAINNLYKRNFVSKFH